MLNGRFAFSTRVCVIDRRGATPTRQFGTVGCILKAIIDPLDTLSSTMDLRELHHQVTCALYSGCGAIVGDQTNFAKTHKAVGESGIRGFMV